MKLIRLIQAEFIKLKYPPIYWLCGFVLFTVLTIIFLSHFVDVDSVASLGKNPWKKIGNAGRAIFSVFMGIPFIVLLISASVYIEHQSNTWKYQYTAPMSRSMPFYGKLLALLLVVIVVIMGLSIGLLVCGYLLDYFMPEMEFGYHTPMYLDFLTKMLHTFLSFLGVFAVQYFLSFRFKGFLIPASIGVVGFVVGIIFGSMDNPLALYFPYTYPAISQNHGLFLIERIPIVDYGGINNVEIHSLLYFAFFIALGNFIEIKKNVS